jgi:hypothetical protein
MTQTTFDNALGEMLQAFETILAAIRQGGGEGDLHNLQQRLIDLMALIERDPGIEAATADLYVAAEALVMDRTAHVQPMARKLRLLSDADRRFRERIPAARPLKAGSRSLWLHKDLRFAA